jgi:hypothetical protein
MALQPCAMAFGDAIDHNCQHCPPGHSEEGLSHSSHGVDHSDSGASPRETDAPQCTILDDFNYDSRIFKVKVKDSPSDESTGIAPSVAGVPFSDNSCAILNIGDTSLLPGQEPPLNILYCVYLI